MRSIQTFNSVVQNDVFLITAMLPPPPLPPPKYICIVYVVDFGVTCTVVNLFYIVIVILQRYNYQLAEMLPVQT